MTEPSFAPAASVARGEGFSQQIALPRFNLLRYFTTASLLVILLAAAGAGVLTVRVVERSFTEEEKDEADSLAEDLVSLLGFFHYDLSQWGAARVPDDLAREVDKELDNFNALDFSLFALDGRPLQRFDNTDGAPAPPPRPRALAAAAAGQIAAHWESGRWPPFALLFGSGKGAIETYTPVRIGGKIVAVARVRRDEGAILAHARQILPGLAAVVALFGAVTFGALWLLVRKADRILARQHADIAAVQAELQRQNRVLEALNRRKDEFYAICSHDLRSPLLSISAGCRLLLEDRERPLDPSGREIVGENKRNAALALHLVDNLLDLARIEAGAETLDAEALNLVEVIHEVVAANRPVANSRSVTLQVLAGCEAAPVLADRIKLLRVFNNLLSNAIKHSPGETVTVSVASSGDDVCVAVADRGPGIPPEQRAHLFDRFTPLARDKKSREEGTGLGLSIVRELVELHGGTISVAPGAERGATFTVRLPSSPRPV